MLHSLPLNWWAPHFIALSFPTTTCYHIHFVPIEIPPAKCNTRRRKI